MQYCSMLQGGVGAVNKIKGLYHFLIYNNIPMLLTSSEKETGGVSYVLNEARRLAGSYGLQPLKIWVVKDAAAKKQLQPYIKHKGKQAPASYYIVFAVWSEISEEKIDHYISRIAEAKHAPVSLLREDKRNVVKAVSKLNEEGKKWAARQADIALRHLLKAAEQVNVGAKEEEVTLSGFDRVLELPAQGLQAVAVVSLQVGAVKQHSGTLESAAAEKELFALV